MSAERVTLEEIQSLRALFLQESNFQVRYDACHWRGWSDSYLLKLGEAAVGYGAIKGRERAARDTVFEFHVLRPFRKSSSRLFAELVAAAGATYIECQSNDLVLSSMLYEFGRDIAADVALFDDAAVTEHTVAGATVRRRQDGDRIFDHAVEPVGDYVLELGGDIVATGGFALHYNPPFADLYMEVRKDRWRQGLGSYLVQELKKQCYLAGRVPAARCHLQNRASRATLTKAGLRVCGFMLIGAIRPEAHGRPPA